MATAQPKKDVTALAAQLDREDLERNKPVETIEDFEKALLDEFDNLIQGEVYTGVKHHVDRELNKKMREIGCLNPRCRNHDHKEMKDPRTGNLDERKKASFHFYLDILYPRSLKGLPGAHCRYCKTWWNPVNMKIMKPADAIEIIRKLRESNLEILRTASR